MNDKIMQAALSPEFAARFWPKIIVGDKESCWDWIAGQDGRGYGALTLYKGKVIKAHRASWLIHKGEIPNDLNVLHTCDNPRCVNPNHLWLGTHLQNNQDKMKKGRWSAGDRSNSTGEQSHFAKLKAEQVLEIRKLYASGVWTYKKLAAQFGVSFQQVGEIVTRTQWKSV